MRQADAWIADAHPMRRRSTARRKHAKKSSSEIRCWEASRLEQGPAPVRRLYGRKHGDRARVAGGCVRVIWVAPNAALMAMMAGRPTKG